MCAHHWKIDKSAEHLVASPFAFEDHSETMVCHAPVYNDDGNLDPSTPLLLSSFNSDDCVTLYTPTTMPWLKEETDAVEEALHDLTHLCFIVIQRVMSFSCNSNLKFLKDQTTDDSIYQLFSTIPSGPNMGYGHLQGHAPENRLIMAYENVLFEVLVDLHHFIGHPALEASKLKLMCFVEDEIWRIDCIWKSAWNCVLDRDGMANCWQSR